MRKIDALPLQRADSTELLFLDEAEQLDLHFERQIADLVKESSAAIGQFHQAFLVFRGAAERAFGVPKQLALHERAHQRSAIDGHEPPMWIRVVYRPRHDFLPRAALSQKQHRQTVASRLVDETPNRQNLR
jgi:hypothetical protein